MSSTEITPTPVQTSNTTPQTHLNSTLRTSVSPPALSSNNMASRNTQYRSVQEQSLLDLLQNNNEGNTQNYNSSSISNNIQSYNKS